MEANRQKIVQPFDLSPGETIMRKPSTFFVWTCSILLFLSLAFAACGGGAVLLQTHKQRKQAHITRTTQEGQARNTVRHSLYQRIEHQLLHRLATLSTRWIPWRGSRMEHGWHWAPSRAKSRSGMQRARLSSLPLMALEY